MRQAPNYIEAIGGPVGIGEEFYWYQYGEVHKDTLVDVVVYGFDDLMAVPESRFLIDASLCHKTEESVVNAAIKEARYTVETTRQQLATAERLLEKHGLLNPPPAAESAVDEPVSVG